MMCRLCLRTPVGDLSGLNIKPGDLVLRGVGDEREAAAYRIPAIRGYDSQACAIAFGPPYAFLFTSLILENVMPSARSLV